MYGQVRKDMKCKFVTDIRQTEPWTRSTSFNSGALRAGLCLAALSLEHRDMADAVLR